MQVLTKIYGRTGSENRLREAFRYFERGKAQTLLELLASPPKGKASEGTQQVRSGTNAHRSVRARLEDVQAVLGKRTLLLEYALGEKRSVVWAISRSGTRTVPSLADEETIAGLVEPYVKLQRQGPLANVDVEQHVRLGREIYRALLEPVRAELEVAKRLIIVPDGVLNYLPFEALPVEERATDKNNGHDVASAIYLGGRYATSYVPSSSVLLALERRGGRTHGRSRALQSQIAIFGGPNLGSAGNAKTPVSGVCGKTAAKLPELPRSTEEAQQIAAVYGAAPNSAVVNLGEMASVKRLRQTNLARYRILHFATHAIAPDRITGFSQPALLLSPSENDDGCLSMSDIFNLRLDADLVVLSACETAVGRMYRGEGMVGLTSAFLYAGSRSVIASLWLVNDQSTSLFMTSFYRHLKQGDPVAEALRQARIEIMGMRVRSDVSTEEQSLASPYFWAPFILVGDRNMNETVLREINR